jgi:hypothetical protein
MFMIVAPRFRLIIKWLKEQGFNIQSKSDLACFYNEEVQGLGSTHEV